MKASFQRYITAVKSISGMSDYYFSVGEKTVIDTDCTLMGVKENASLKCICVSCSMFVPCLFTC